MNREAAQVKGLGQVFEQDPFPVHRVKFDQAASTIDTALFYITPRTVGLVEAGMQKLLTVLATVAAQANATVASPTFDVVEEKVSSEFQTRDTNLAHRVARIMSSFGLTLKAQGARLITITGELVQPKQYALSWDEVKAEYARYRKFSYTVAREIGDVVESNPATIKDQTRGHFIAQAMIPVTGKDPEKLMLGLSNVGIQ